MLPAKILLVRGSIAIFCWCWCWCWCWWWWVGTWKLELGRCQYYKFKNSCVWSQILINYYSYYYYHYYFSSFSQEERKNGKERRISGSMLYTSNLVVFWESSSFLVSQDIYSLVKGKWSPQKSSNTIMQLQPRQYII